MRKLLVVCAALAILGLIAAPSAATGGKGKGGQAPPAISSIALADYGATSRGGPQLGGVVGFTTVAAGLAGWEYPMVAVWCYQDVNGDGIQVWPNDGGDLVYMQLDYPDVGFVLGGGSSDWLVSGGPADCEANLYAYGNRGGNQTIRDLAETYFWAAG